MKKKYVIGDKAKTDSVMGHKVVHVRFGGPDDIWEREQPESNDGTRGDTESISGPPMRRIHRPGILNDYARELSWFIHPKYPEAPDAD